MPKMRSSEFCGVSWCSSVSITKGLCGTHYQEHRKHALHADVVANNEIVRSNYHPSTRGASTWTTLHRKFAQSLPISKKEQVLLTRALDRTAKNLGVVK